MDLPTSPSLQQKLFASLDGVAEHCGAFRQCPALPDIDWLKLGISRALHDLPSGRAFLQQIGPLLPRCPQCGHFFEALKSARRLSLCQQASDAIGRKLTDDPFADLENLRDFDLYAADGHWHSAAVHDAPIDGSKRAVGHFFALNLRTRALVHLTHAQGKKEHDMHALKRLELQTLRHGAPKGRKVLYAYDCAGIDFAQWHKWKQSGGVYFISLTKENMKLEVIGKNPIEPSDLNNAGIEADELVATSQHVLVRRIRYTHPATGETFEFITNELTLAPGLIAFLYLRRWDLEKVFDELKNKLGADHAWASSDTAKQMQAHLLCLAHNLMKLFERQLAKEHQVSNQAEIARRTKRLTQQKQQAHARSQVLPALVQSHQRLTQTSVKLYRWLRAHFFSPLPLVDLLPSLIRSYASL
jgi:Transposase DDE domain